MPRRRPPIAARAAQGGREKEWSRHRDLNPEPDAYKATALPIELYRQKGEDYRQPLNGQNALISCENGFSKKELRNRIIRIAYDGIIFLITQHIMVCEKSESTIADDAEEETTNDESGSELL